MHEMCVVKAMGGFSGNLFEIIARYKPCFTVIDSLSKLVVGTGSWPSSSPR